MKNQATKKHPFAPAESPRELAPVPGLDSMLFFSWEDVYKDRTLRFYRKIKRKGKSILYEVSPCYRLGHSKSPFERYSRVFIHFWGESGILYFTRAKLVYCCCTGTPYNELKGWVIDHINNEPTDDFPSNLQRISYAENISRSKLCCLYKKLHFKEKRKAKKAVDKFLEVELSKLEKKYPNDKPLVYYNLRKYYREIVPNIINSFINQKQ